MTKTIAQSTSHVFHRDLNKQYPMAERGEGVWIYDRDGKAYLDGSSGALVCNLGHGNKAIIAEIYKQMQRITFAHTSQFTTENLEKYASSLADILPGELNYAYFLSGGSEAMDTALKLARQYHIERGKSSKHKFIARWTSFHGHTLGALSVGGYASWRRPHDPVLIPALHINPPFCYHCPYGLRHPECHMKCATDLEDLILREGPDTVSAFVLEPIIGSSAGGVYPPDEYFRIVRDICNKYDILVIADEVMCGFGRSGKFFASEHWNFEPDIIVCGKGMSSGYAPLGGVLISNTIYEAYKQGSGRFIHGHTFSGNPVSVTAGKAVLDYMRNHAVLDNVNSRGAQLEGLLRELMNEFSFIGNVRGKGLLWGVEIVKDRSTKDAFDPSMQLTNLLVKKCFNNGLIVYPSQKFLLGQAGDSIMVAPPLIIDAGEIEILVEKLRAALRQFQDQILP